MIDVCDEYIYYIDPKLVGQKYRHPRGKYDWHYEYSRKQYLFDGVWEIQHRYLRSDGKRWRVL